MKTIRRNQRKTIQAIFSNIKEAVCYSLSSNFSGVKVDASAIEGDFVRCSFAKITMNDNGLSGEMKVHINLWYKFTLAQGV